MNAPFTSSSRLTNLLLPSLPPTSSLRHPINPSPGSGPVASPRATSPCLMAPPALASPSWPSPWPPASPAALLFPTARPPTGHVILLAPYDSPTDTLKPRLEAAGGDPAHLLLVHPLLEDTSLSLARTRSYAFPLDLDHLATLIRTLNARLLIIDPASAIPGLARCLPALVDLARQNTCAILLTRSLRQSPADPLHSSGPASPLLEAARSRLLLAADP